jgi:hypothetical protein
MASGLETLQMLQNMDMQRRNAEMQQQKMLQQKAEFEAKQQELQRQQMFQQQRDLAQQAVIANEVGSSQDGFFDPSDPMARAEVAATLAQEGDLTPLLGTMAAAQMGLGEAGLDTGRAMAGVYSNLRNIDMTEKQKKENEKYFTDKIDMGGTIMGVLTDAGKQRFGTDKPYMYFDKSASPSSVAYSKGTPEYAQREAETESAKMWAKEGTQVIFDMNEAAYKAQSMKQQLGMMSQLVEAAEPDMLAGIKLWANRAANALGMEPFDDTMGPSEALRALSNNMALKMRDPKGLSGGLPGNVSDKDLTFLTDSIPKLTSSKAGNKLIIEILNAQQDMLLEKQQIMQEYLDITGKTYIDKNFAAYYNHKAKMQDVILSLKDKAETQIQNDSWE